jgi:hypothetical protein
MIKMLTAGVRGCKLASNSPSHSPGFFGMIKAEHFFFKGMRTSHAGFANHLAGHSPNERI